MRDRQYPFAFFDRFALEVAQAQANSNGVTIARALIGSLFDDAIGVTIGRSFAIAWNE